MRKAVILPLTVALALASCNRAPDERLPDDNVAVVDNGGENANMTTALPAENAVNTTVKPPPAPGLTDEQQIHDDADASGLTSRLPDETPSTHNETLPAK